MSRERLRHVVVTGASSGIGLALALEYAAPGVVLGLVARDETRLKACEAACRKRGATVVVGRIDVRNASQLEVWLHRFDDAHPIDLLIANAGAASTLASSSDWEALARIMTVNDTNFYGTLHAVLPVIERMRVRRSGQIAMVSSIAALRGMAISPAYCASKAAIKAYGDSIRPLLAREGILLSVVLPGFVKTSMSDVFPGDKPFMWVADKAARHIRDGLAAKRAEIAFPAMLAVGMRLLNVLPVRIADAVLSRLSYIPREGR